MFEKFITKIAVIAIEKYLETDRFRSELVSKEKAVKSLTKRNNILIEEVKSLREAVSKRLNKENVMLLAKKKEHKKLMDECPY